MPHGAGKIIKSIGNIPKKIKILVSKIRIASGSYLYRIRGQHPPQPVPPNLARFSKQLLELKQRRTNSLIETLRKIDRSFDDLPEVSVSFWGQSDQDLSRKFMASCFPFLNNPEEQPPSKIPDELIWLRRKK
jgi:hypothetical protein